MGFDYSARILSIKDTLGLKWVVIYVHLHFHHTLRGNMASRLTYTARQGNIPVQSELAQLLVSLYNMLINQMADQFGRDLLFDHLDPNNTPELKHAELLRLMEAKAGDDQTRIHQANHNSADCVT